MICSISTELLFFFFLLYVLLSFCASFTVSCNIVYSAKNTYKCPFVIKIIFVGSRKHAIYCFVFPFCSTFLLQMALSLWEWVWTLPVLTQYQRSTWWEKNERIFKKNTFKTKPGCFYYVIMFWTREPDEHFAPEIFSSWYFLCWLDKMAVATESLKPSLEILYLVI